MAPAKDSDGHETDGDVNANAIGAAKIGEPSTVKPTSSEQAAAPTDATKAEKQEFIVEHVRLFCSRVEDKAKDPQGKVANMHLLKSLAQRGNYSDVDTFHFDYDMLFDRVLQGSPDLIDKVSEELRQFGTTECMWWPFCYKLPIQEKRQAYLKEVLELVKDDKGSAYDLYHTVRKLRKVYDPGGRSRLGMGA